MKLLFWVGAGLSRASGVPAPPEYDRARYWLERDQFHQDLAGWRQQALACEPNRGHEVLGLLQQRNPEVRIVTTNQDRLLQRAGCSVLELHGEGISEDRRPLLLGEELDANILEQVITWIEECETLVVLGTSSTVQPACELPLRACGRARLIEINLVDTPLSDRCDECWRGPAEELLQRFLSA
jgi:NAD-dependent SIR2 family protein deacetylase